MAEIIVVGVVMLAVIGALVALSIKAIAATTNAATNAVDAANTKGLLAVATATIATRTDEANSERKRADALDAMLIALEADPDPAGARDRVLAKWKQAKIATDAKNEARPQPAGAGNANVPLVVANDAALLPPGA